MQGFITTVGIYIFMTVFLVQIGSILGKALAEKEWSHKIVDAYLAFIVLLLFIILNQTT